MEISSGLSAKLSPCNLNWGEMEQKHLQSFSVGKTQESVIADYPPSSQPHPHSMGGLLKSQHPWFTHTHPDCLVTKLASKKQSAECQQTAGVGNSRGNTMVREGGAPPSTKKNT